jgi:hypothetical protein
VVNSFVGSCIFQANDDGPGEAVPLLKAESANYVGWTTQNVHSRSVLLAIKAAQQKQDRRRWRFGYGDPSPKVFYKVLIIRL